MSESLLEVSLYDQPRGKRENKSSKSYPRRYRKEEKIGEGTYGNVYYATDTKTKKKVAIKKIRILDEDEGVPSTAIREVSILKEMIHPNIVDLLDVFHDGKRLYLVFEFIKMDLKNYMDIMLKKQTLIPMKLTKKIMHALLCSVAYCHSQRIVHRDMKPQNVLVNIEKGIIKICDFGLARAFNIPVRAYTHEVVTLWYRAPEILLGAKKYSTPVDIWSLGAIFFEIVTLLPLWPGDSEIDQLMKIFNTMGTPTNETWEGINEITNFQKVQFPDWKGNKLAYTLKQRRESCDELLIDLIERMLVLNPQGRITAKDSLRHPFFKDVEKN